jgi:uncharacterized protein (TIGR02145 family)
VGTISAAVQFNPDDSLNYSKVTGLTVSLVIAKKTLAVTADNKSKFFAATPLADPQLSVTIAGFVNGDGTAALGGTLAVSRTSGDTAGVYSITANGYTSNNYDITYLPGVFTITGGVSQTISFGALQNKTYGDVDFALPATATSRLTVSYSSSNPAVVSITGSTARIVGSGAVTITAQQLGDNNYAAATPASQPLTVATKSLTITGISVSTKFYDGTTTAAINGTAALIGVHNGDNVTVTGSPTATFANATAGSSKSVTISGYTLGGTASGNYVLVQPTGLTATISKATPTISTNPTASAIELGQTLSSSTLTGGVATVSGTFAFTTPGVTPALGTTSSSVTFTPTDNTDYNTQSCMVSVTVNLPRVTDGDGNIYESILIGNQIWMKENLRTTSYNDRTPIPNETVNTAWGELTTHGYCYYGNTSNTDSIKKFGALYNWYTISTTNAKKIAPTGWHVPTAAEWDTLQNWLIAKGYNYDGLTSGNKIAKSMAAKTDWQSSSTIGAIGNNLFINNSCGFSALPSGCRFNDGTYYYQSNICYLWSATQYYVTGALYRGLRDNIDYLIGDNDNKRSGFSVRLVRD